MTAVGAYEAKTKLPELLRGVQAGERYTITHRGEPIAELVPVANRRHGAADAVERGTDSRRRHQGPDRGW